MNPTACCFCSEPVSDNSAVEIRIPIDADSTQGLWAHGSCLSIRLHSSVPTLLPTNPLVAFTVFLAVTAGGLSEALNLAAGRPVWCSPEAISEQQFTALKCNNVTRFNFSFADNMSEAIVRAIATIQEHHPGMRIWLERDNGL